MQKLVVVVDDLRTFTFPAIYLRTSQQAKTWLQDHHHYYIDELWLDHDLGMLSEKDGVFIATMLELAAKDPDLTRWHIGKVYIHSANPSGAHRMYRSLVDVYPTLCVNPAGFLRYD